MPEINKVAKGQARVRVAPPDQGLIAAMYKGSKTTPVAEPPKKGYFGAEVGGEFSSAIRLYKRA